MIVELLSQAQPREAMFTIRQLIKTGDSANSS